MFSPLRLQGQGLIMTSNDTYYEGVFTGLNEVNGKGVMVLNNGDRISGTFDGTWADGIKMNNAVYQKYTPDNSMIMVCNLHRHIVTFKLQCIKLFYAYCSVHTTCSL